MAFRFFFSIFFFEEVE